MGYGRDLDETEDELLASDGADLEDLDDEDDGLERPASAATDPRILWDVVEEHLDEAEFAFGLLDRALDSPRYSLDEVERGPERRLWAHVDGLLVGGPAVAVRLLTEALTEGGPARRAAAAGALFLAGSEDRIEARLEDVADPAVISGLFRTPGDRVDLWVAERLASRPTAPLTTALLTIAAARGLRVDGLDSALTSDDPALLAAAVEATRASDARRYATALARHLEHPDPLVRDAALRAGLQAGLPRAWALCRTLAAGRVVPHPLALDLLGALGGPAEQQVLLRALSLPTHLHAAVRALGLCGSPDVIPSLLPLLDHPEPPVAQLAVEAIVAIAGPAAALYRDPPPEPDVDALLPLADDDLDADLVPSSTAELPWPDAPAIAAWWSRATLPRGRSIDGRPATPAAMIEALRTGSTRGNQVLALVLAIKSGGALRLDPLRLASAQRAQLDGLRPGDVWVRDLARGSG